MAIQQPPTPTQKQQPLPLNKVHRQTPTTTTTTHHQRLKQPLPTQSPTQLVLLLSQSTPDQLDQLTQQELQDIQRTLCNDLPHHPPHSLHALCSPLLHNHHTQQPLHAIDHSPEFPSEEPSNLRKRSLSSRPRLLLPRQSTQGNGSGPSADGYPSCTSVSNAILSCFPDSHTTLVQHTWSKFIWNNNYPTFIGSRFVDIYLYNADSETPTTSWTSIANDRGMIGIYAEDSWFPPVTSWTNGSNLTYPYFFVITTAGAPLTGGEQHQATFRVVQTAPPPAFVSSSLAAAVYTSSMLASISSASHTPTPTPNSSLQPGSNNDNSFPRWEIAIIVILGIFALLIFSAAAYLAFTNARKRRQVRLWQAAALGHKSGSVGSTASHSPMIQNTEGAALIGHNKNQGAIPSAREFHSPSSSRPGSPLSATNVVGNTFAIHASDHSQGIDTRSNPDGPITSVDATIMADAFRKALRKPEFAVTSTAPGHSRPVSRSHSNLGGETTADEGGQEERYSTPASNIRGSMHAQVVSLDDTSSDHHHNHPHRNDDNHISELDLDDDEDDEEAKEIMDRELASEGRSMTSVDNRKRPQVHR